MKIKTLRKYPKLFRFLKWYNSLYLPIISDLKISHVLTLFARNIVRNDITTKASGIAFNVFLALFPGLLFLFTLLPYLPIQNLDTEVLAMLKSVMPSNAYSIIEDTLSDILKIKRGGLLSLGFITTLYFASSGVFSLTETFSPNSQKSFFYRRAISIGLTILLGMFLISSLVLLILGEIAINVSLEYFQIDSTGKVAISLFILRWVLVLLLVFMSFSLLYYIGDEKRMKWRYVLPGAFIATLFTLLTSFGFAYYVNHFGTYNKAYGSLGALVATMLWIYYNTIIILAGHEFIKAIKSNVHFFIISKHKKRFNFLRIK